MPLPAWTPGGRRTSVWGGTGLIMAKQTKHPDLAWELAKFLYFRREGLGERFRSTNILPALKDAWTLPEIGQPNPYWSNVPIGKAYAALAPETPPLYSSPIDQIGRVRLDQAYNRSATYYEKHGEAGLMEVIRAELAQSAAEVRALSERDAQAGGRELSERLPPAGRRRRPTSSWRPT